jgi:hypothetical protein
MKTFRFEIVRLPNGRYAWLFVVLEGRRKRVLAGSSRDYRSRARAERAIERMRGAPIEPSVPDPEPFPLPATSFRIVPGVLPLMVREFADSASLTAGPAV